MTYALHMNRRTPVFATLGLLLALLATEAAPQTPAVTLLAPADQDVSNQTTNTFTATASAPAGLTSATLLVGDPPGTATFTGPAQVLDTQLTADTPTTPAGSGTTVKVDGLSPHCPRTARVPHTDWRRWRPGAPGCRDHLRHAPPELHQRRQHDGVVQAGGGLGRGSGHLERAACRRALVGAWRRRPGLPHRNVRAGRLHHHGTTAHRHHAHRPGVERRRAEPRHRADRNGHRRRQLRQQRVGQFAGAHGRLQRKSAACCHPGAQRHDRHCKPGRHATGRDPLLEHRGH